jgi:hypothetical protein
MTLWKKNLASRMLRHICWMANPEDFRICHRINIGPRLRPVWGRKVRNFFKKKCKCLKNDMFFWWEIFLARKIKFPQFWEVRRNSFGAGIFGPNCYKEVVLLFWYQYPGGGGGPPKYPPKNGFWILVSLKHDLDSLGQGMNTKWP